MLGAPGGSEMEEIRCIFHALKVKLVLEQTVVFTLNKKKKFNPLSFIRQELSLAKLWLANEKSCFDVQQPLEITQPG